MKYKIISDGTRHGTKLIDSETGASIEFSYIEWHISSISVPEMTIQFRGAPIEITGEFVSNKLEIVA